MQRGSTSIYKNLFEEVAETTANTQPTQQDKKVECILHYYYYQGRKTTILNGVHTRLNYPSLLEVVSTAFFLETITVHNIIKQNMDELSLVKQEWKDKAVPVLQKNFEKRWPMFVW